MIARVSNLVYGVHDLPDVILGPGSRLGADGTGHDQGERERETLDLERQYW